MERLPLSSGRCRRAQRDGIDQAQGQAGFIALSYELPMKVAAMMGFEKPACPLVPCSDLLCAGHGTRLKGEFIIATRAIMSKSQTQPDGGEGCSVSARGSR